MQQGKNPEWDLIERVRRRASPESSFVRKSIGDDCALLTTPAGTQTAVTTDLLLENVHFRRHWIHPRLLGRKSLAASLSDLASTGADPLACLLSLALPPQLIGDFFDAFVEGFLQQCERWGCPLVGGDLSRADAVCVSVTAWGSVRSPLEAVLRSGARPGDHLVLVGDVGYSRLGLEILKTRNPHLEAGQSDEESLEAWAGDGFELRCLKAHLAPRPLIREGRWLCQKEVARAMIDISDGLAADLLHLARESGLSGEIDLEKLPLPERGFGELGALEAALDGGEDYALLAAASPEQIEELSGTFPDDLAGFRLIGSFSEGRPAVFVGKDGEHREYVPRGFNHFQCD